MKAFAQFYQLSTGYVAGTIPPVFEEAHKKPIEACGDRGVIILDARLSLSNMREIAETEAHKRGYIGYSLHRGDFMRNTCFHKYTSIR